MRVLLIGVCLLCLGTFEVKAQYSGELLFKMLLEEERLTQGKDNIDELMVGVGHGYVGGVIEALELTRLVCPPADISMEQLRKTFLQYLKDNPGDHKEKAIGLFLLAMAEKGWACPN